MTDRTIIAITGADREKFLDGLVTNRLPAVGDGLRYAALLTPQGKYIADFLILTEPDRLLLDVSAALAPTLAQRLGMYKLRADVGIDDSGLSVSRGTGPAPDGAWPDPRHPALGWRHYGDGGLDDGTDWDALRIEHLIPEAGSELTPESYILEMGFERLHGVDLRKGCYVGQEVTARMKHKTELRKGLARVSLDRPAPTGAEITAAGKPAGTLLTARADRALAYLRFDRATGPLAADEAGVTMEVSAQEAAASGL
ncbi:CAF17-like 4Fe-4S cluster assembly/insertion protein YgfZ [Roseisalinus antarcticus]|uniref:Putative global regulator n=1 Tax=Roseisalinus antarcticus TaxID=254357 RepID=A0A1Y5SS95_9RHOB|nr:folate-binding protein YgfZ [Roseisalinus antarcticus]SLN46837.1 putative global regulator [Roseisalinus antarcticus]